MRGMRGRQHRNAWDERKAAQKCVRGGAWSRKMREMRGVEHKKERDEGEGRKK